jgi:hypothetical protein
LQPGEESYEQFAEERDGILSSLARRAKVGISSLAVALWTIFSPVARCLYVVKSFLVVLLQGYFILLAYIVTSVCRV